jgi:hypothetical protein
MVSVQWQAGNNGQLTVHIFIPGVLKAQVYDRVGGSDNLVLRDIAVVRVPRVPAECRKSALQF